MELKLIVSALGVDIISCYRYTQSHVGTRLPVPPRDINVV